MTVSSPPPDDDGMSQNKIRLMEPCGSPLISDLLGPARDFVNELRFSMESSGIMDVMGVSGDRTFLAYGLPGTGKTMSIHALNNEINYPTLSNYRKSWDSCSEEERDKLPDLHFPLAVVPYDIGRYGTAYINMGSRKVQDLFDKCYFLSLRGNNVLIMLDEADALLSSRSNSFNSHNEDRKVLETIMKNLQELHEHPRMYCVLMTNLPDLCDGAALRAGRIDRKFEFTLPGPSERAVAYKSIIRRINGAAKYTVIPNYNSGTLSELSEGFNYADIEGSITSAVKFRARRFYDSNKGVVSQPPTVSYSDLERAVLQHKDSFTKSSKSRRIGF